MKKLLLSSILFAVALTGFSQFAAPSPVQGSQSVAVAPPTRAGGVPVFETMENPYNLARMRRLTGNASLQPTHFYGRFLPQDSTEQNLLEDVLELDLFDYPLDIHIEDDETYVDPTIPEGEFTWQYTVVPANFIFPTGITWEKLYDCYIPSDNEEVPPATRVGDESNLERAAILDCGYTIPPETRAGGRPAGTVTVLDDSAIPNRYVPVKGVKVKCHYFLKVGSDYTDASGNYSISKKFYVKPYYTVVFKNEKDFILWSGLGYRAKIRISDRQSQSGHNIVITRLSTIMPPPSGFEHLWDLGWTLAAVNNAAYDYYQMCETTGISKPPKGLKILVHHSFGNSAPMIRRMSAGQVLTKANWAAFLAWGTGLIVPVTVIDGLFKFVEPDVTINSYVPTKNYSDFYETTNHELSHASHFSKVGSNYWASYVSYIVQHNGYGNGQGAYYGNCEVGEMWGYAMGHIQEHEQFSISTAGAYPYGIQDGEDGDWIHPHPIWALITRGVLTKKQVFDCLTSDVNTKAKLITKLCTGKTTAVANAITTAFAHNDVPTITGGSDKPTLNTNVTYSVQAAANLLTGFVFNGWTVSPSSGYTVPGGTSGRNLTIKFTSGETYTLSANFTLPNNSGTYSATKTVAIVPTIIGPDTVCYFGGAFTLSYVPAGTITWSVSGPFTVSGNGVTATVTRTGTGATAGTLTASVNGTPVIVKTIIPCTPPFITGPTTVVNQYDTAHYTISNLPAGAFVSWVATADNAIPSFSTGGKTFSPVCMFAGWFRVSAFVRMNGVSSQVGTYSLWVEESEIPITGPALLSPGETGTYTIPSHIATFAATYLSPLQLSCAGALSLQQTTGNSITVKANHTLCSGSSGAIILYDPNNDKQTTRWIGLDGSSVYCFQLSLAFEHPNVMGMTLFVIEGAGNNAACTWTCDGGDILTSGSYWLQLPEIYDIWNLYDHSQYCLVLVYNGNDANVYCNKSTPIGNILRSLSLYANYSMGNGVFTIYPNPASSTLHVEIDPSKKANVSAGNMVRKAGGTCEVQMVAVQTGALVLRHTVKDFDTNFDLNLTTVPDGLYLLRLVQNGQTVHTKNILVQH